MNSITFASFLILTTGSISPSEFLLLLFIQVNRLSNPHLPGVVFFTRPHSENPFCLHADFVWIFLATTGYTSTISFQTAGNVGVDQLPAIPSSSKPGTCDDSKNFDMVCTTVVALPRAYFRAGFLCDCLLLDLPIFRETVGSVFSKALSKLHCQTC